MVYLKVKEILNQKLQSLISMEIKNQLVFIINTTQLSGIKNMYYHLPAFA